MIVQFSNRQGYMLPLFCKLLVKSVILATLAAENASMVGEVSVSFVTPEEIRALNRKFRNIDKVTDVLSFPSEDTHTMGDIVINIKRMKQQAIYFGHTEKREIAFLAIHSTLHLLGYDHMTKEDERVMRAKQRKILRSIGL